MMILYQREFRDDFYERSFIYAGTRSISKYFHTRRVIYNAEIIPINEKKWTNLWKNEKRKKRKEKRVLTRLAFAFVLQRVQRLANTVIFTRWWVARYKLAFAIFSSISGIANAPAKKKKKKLKLTKFDKKLVRRRGGGWGTDQLPISALE